MQDQTFEQGMAILSETLRTLTDKDPDRATRQLEMWRRLLDDLRDDDFLEACCIVAQRTREYYPGTNIVAMIRDTVRDAVQKIASPEEAWGEVIAWRQRGTSSRIPDFSSPAIRQTVEAIGWPDLFWAEPDQFPTMRAHFFRCYQAYQTRQDLNAIGETTKALLGAFSQKFLMPKATP